MTVKVRYEDRAPYKEFKKGKLYQYDNPDKKEIIIMALEDKLVTDHEECISALTIVHYNIPTGELKSYFVANFIEFKGQITIEQ